MRTQSKQRKFIVYGQSRSGSTLLIDLINLHPEITCEGELLQSDWGYIPSENICKLVKCYPYPFFEYRRKISKTSHYGFKLFCFHLRNIEKSIKKLSEAGWEIIYLKRENMLLQAISNLTAKQTKFWHYREGQEKPHYQVNLPVVQLQKELRTRERWGQKEHESLKGLRFLQVTYEKDLLNMITHQNTAQKIFSHLGLQSVPVNTDLKKTNYRHYSEVLVNYDEIISFIKNSQYCPYLKDMGEL